MVHYENTILLFDFLNCKTNILKIVGVVIIILLPFTLLAQVKGIGLPNIRNYPKSDYKGGTQNWGVTQDPDGFMYFANNNGLLRFDGIKWDLFRVSDISPIRSVCADKKGNIYIGLNNDFGILNTRNPNGPVFKSLKDKIPSDITETEIIWRIYETQFGIVFQSFRYIFIYNEDKIHVIRPQKAFYYSFYVNNRLFFHEPGTGLFEYINGFVNRVPWADELVNTDILAIIDIHDNNLLIGTAQQGWYFYSMGKLQKWEVAANKLTEQFKLYCAVKTDENHIAIGTILNGVIIANTDGEIIQHFNLEKGLQNNTILSMFRDISGNLWLGLDNGVDFIELNSPLSYISSYDGISTGYCGLVHNGNLYLGTNQGLFVKSFNDKSSTTNKKFKLVENTEGQVWCLKIIDGQLICGHNFGTFIIEGEKATKISDEPGGWTYLQPAKDSSLMIGGNYNGLALFKKTSRGWIFSAKVKNFNESSRFLTEDGDGNIWMSHGSKGVFRIRLNESFDSIVSAKLYDSKSGFPTDDQNILISINKNWYISTIDGLYEYSSSTDRFIKNEELTRLFNLNEQLKFAVMDKEDNLWYIAGSQAGVLHHNEDLSYSKITAPFSQLKNTFVGGFEFLYVHSNDNVFFGTEDGFAHYSSRIITSFNDTFKTFITKVEIPYLDTVFYQPDINYKFPFWRNAFRFYYAAPYYLNPGQLEFSYFIENYSDNWSAWSSDNYRDITNLPENEYVFRVKARNSFGIESEEAQFAFVIHPPWHRSLIALYLYLITGIVLIIALYRFMSRRIEKSKIKERKKHQKELIRKEKEYEQQSLIAEKEIIKLQNEKLEAEKIFLDKELANQTLNLVEKNKFLTKINQELKHVANETHDGAVKTKMAILKKRIDREIDDHRQKKIFESYFEEVHADFFARLKVQFPQLSPNDLRLCAYIRMNISTKEIATLLNISERGVEISRYRLRKKLELARDVNLSAYLLTV